MHVLARRQPPMVLPGTAGHHLDAQTAAAWANLCFKIDLGDRVEIALNLFFLPSTSS